MMKEVFVLCLQPEHDGLYVLGVYPTREVGNSMKVEFLRHNPRTDARDIDVRPVLFNALPKFGALGL